MVAGTTDLGFLVLRDWARGNLTSQAYCCFHTHIPVLVPQGLGFYLSSISPLPCHKVLLDHCLAKGSSNIARSLGLSTDPEP